MVIITLILRLLFPIYIYIDGKKRGDNTVKILLWAVCTAIVPLVGPFYFMFGRKGKVQEKQDDGVIDVEATVVEELNICSICGKEFEETLTVCPHCNNTVKRG